MSDKTVKKTRSAKTSAKKPTAATKTAAIEPLVHQNPAPVAAPSPVTTSTPQPEPMPIPDFEALSSNMAKLVEVGGRAAAAYFKPAEEGQSKNEFADTITGAIRTLGDVAEYWLANPTRTLEAQTALTGSFLSLWAQTLQRLSGEDAPPVLPLDPRDTRFTDPEWRANPIFDFLRQAYGITSNWANDLIVKAEDVDPDTRERAQFYMRQIISALSPSNYLPTNPELWRATLAQNGENLVRGLEMFAEDVEAGHGQLKIRQSDSSKFKLGENMAMTKGKVIFRNELIELIQYEPTTPDVMKRPLLIIPPWINKFYILDLNPDKSFVRWCVEQGLTVFIVSWVNPDERHAQKGFGDYMREGIFAALDAIEGATGERDVTAIGYCVGGTLLSVTLAYMAAIGDQRITSATLFTTQVDFTDAGDLKFLADENTIRGLEEKMAEHGYLEGSNMASAFNMLRPNELIWNYIVNNYLKGKDPMAFDLLAWNSDNTRMPAANHSFYLRNFYMSNKLTKGELDLDGVHLDLSKVTIPIYNLAAKEDHIAPARSVYNGAKYFGGPMRYVLAGSGHIAGVINPATKPKYQYWYGPDVHETYEQWVAHATEHTGSWWVDWIEWIRSLNTQMVPARIPGDHKLTPICDAPGTFVLVKA